MYRQRNSVISMKMVLSVSVRLSEVVISSSVRSHQKANKNSLQKSVSSVLSSVINQKTSKILLSISHQDQAEKSSMSRFSEKKKETISQLEFSNR